MKLLIVDGNPLLYRAAVHNMVESNGLPVGILVGFPALLKTLVNHVEPTHLAIVLDERGRPNWRKRVFAGYKASRGSTVGTIDVQDLNRQALLVHEMLSLYGFPVYHAPGIEGDDLVGILATEAASHPFTKSVVIASQDTDFFQLLHDPIRLYDGIKRRYIDAEAAEKHSGVPVKDWRLHAALSGAGGDDIPTPHGVGKKYAAQIASTYQSLDHLFASKGALLMGQKWKRTIAESEEMVRFAYRLVGIATCDDMSELDADDLRVLRATLSRKQPINRMGFAGFIARHLTASQQSWVSDALYGLTTKPADWTDLVSRIDARLPPRDQE